MKPCKTCELSTRILEASGTPFTTIYFFHKIKGPPSPQTVARIGGNPIGVTPDIWPSFNDEPMEHIITLDLDAMPVLKTGVLTDARAVVLFMSDRIKNEAFEPNTKETSIRILSQEEITNDDVSGALRTSDEPASGYEVVSVDVPVSVFGEMDELEGPLADLEAEIYAASARAAGKPIWLQSEEYQGHFLLQFDESFIDVSLGDAGIMYMFADTAFWQCH